jgi:RNA polymerase sigma-70 factor (ECF subfamily)
VISWLIFSKKGDLHSVSRHAILTTWLELILTETNEVKRELMRDNGTSYSLLHRAVQEQVQQRSDAWEQIVKLYAPLVYHWCHSWGAQATDAENICQEVFGALLSSLPSFQEKQRQGSFRAWLKAIAHNKMVDYLRVWERSAMAFGGSEASYRLSQIPSLDDLDEYEASRDLQILYRQAVELIRNEFSDQDWKAFFLVAVNGISPTEAAVQLGMTVNSVYLAKSRIVKRVREEFEGLIDST